MDIAQVHLGDGQRHRGQCVGERDRREAVAAGVDHDPGAVKSRVVDGVDQCALMIALHRPYCHVELGGGRGDRLLDLLQGRRPVDLGLPGAEEIQVRPVDQQQSGSLGHRGELTRPLR
jgi:hypothetical protein